MPMTMRRGSLMRCGSLRAANANEPRRCEAHRRGALRARREAASKTLLEVGEMADHDLARAVVVVTSDGLDDLLVRLLRRAARLLVAQVADRRDEQLAVCLDRR